MELILTHSNTDFDGLAAQLAAHKLYPQALPLLSPHLNDNVREFAALHREGLPFVRMADLPEEPVTRVVLVDTATVPHLPVLGDGPLPAVIIDHHPLERPLAPHEELICEETGATTTILARRLMDGQAPLTPVEATLLLLGIYEDTGGLALPGTRQVDVLCAAWLLGLRARIEAVGEFLQRPLTAAQEQIYHQLEAGMRMEELDGWSILLAAARVEGSVPELSTLAHRLRDLYAPAVIALAIATGESGTQLILRSNGEALDVGALAGQFGGGGHRTAAAAYVRGRAAPELLGEVEAAIRSRLRPALTAAAIMTGRVRGAPLDATVEQAGELMARYGHSALPVLDADGAVKGLISRRDLDRAERHGLRAAPVARYMWQGPTLIGPDTPVQAVRRALAADNGERTGRLLVVDERRRLLGIITRGDLLRSREGSAAPDSDGHDSIAELLEQFLDAVTSGLLRRAAAIAERQDSALYIVGGTVRDMLLGRRQDDLDLVVEGDAIRLAEALAAELGGHTRSHAQFGTATLELPEGWADKVTRWQGDEKRRRGEEEKRRGGEEENNSVSVLPLSPSPPLPLSSRSLSLDFVIARTEFYEHPSALPDVEASSLRHDLHRRDFTVNTLAVCLNPSRYGRLYDFYGGRRDLERRLIRVLHNLSFIDDPTRILRAVRLAARLDFTIEPRTRELIADALDQGVLGRTTPQRIANELRLILREEAPERAMAMLDELGILQHLHPALRWSPELARQFAAARGAAGREVDLADLYLGLIVYPLTAAQREELIERYRPSAALARLLREFSALQERLPALREPGLPDSQVDRLLHGMGDTALAVARLAESGAAPGYIGRYLRELRPVRLAVDGDFLRAAGLRPGPLFGRLLAELRAARLDGQVRSREEQQAWARRAAEEYLREGGS